MLAALVAARLAAALIEKPAPPCDFFACLNTDSSRFAWLAPARTVEVLAFLKVYFSAWAVKGFGTLL